MAWIGYQLEQGIYSNTFMENKSEKKDENVTLMYNNKTR